MEVVLGSIYLNVGLHDYITMFFKVGLGTSELGLGLHLFMCLLLKKIRSVTVSIGGVGGSVSWVGVREGSGNCVHHRGG